MLNPADPAFVARLTALLPGDVISAAEPRHLEEPRGRWIGQAGCLARPRTTAEVSTLLAACHAARVPVVPRGGGTGLVCGQVMPTGPAPVVLSLERMRAVRGVFPRENMLVIEAGATLSEARAAAEAAGRMFPLSLASEGSCTIGGNLATNAGGVNVLRYGNARELCLGIEAVLPDGQVIHGLKRLRKDNTGYDIRNLLIGAEGTLGVITAASLRLVLPPPVTGAALMVVPGPGAALDLLARAESLAPGCVSAFELIHRTGFDFLAETMPELRLPFADPPEWSVLIDLGLPHGLSADHLLADLFEAALDAQEVSDGLIATSEAQRAGFWTLRESLPEGNRRIGSISSHDVSLPLSDIPDFLDQAWPALQALGPVRINCFGHLGDGNLHFNVFPPKGQDRRDFNHLAGPVKTLVHDMVAARGGSFSAEHGVGRLKTGDLERYGDPARLAAMRAVKAALDPVGIMNPGAVLA